MSPFQSLAEWRAVGDVFMLGFGFGMVAAGLMLIAVVRLGRRK